MDDVKDVVKTVQVEQPIDCIRFIKNIAVKCYDKIRNSGKSNSVQKVIEEYEKLLQKSELKIRDLIRVAQRPIHCLNLVPRMSKSIVLVSTSIHCDMRKLKRQ